MSKQDLLSIIPFAGKKLVEKEKIKISSNEGNQEQTSRAGSVESALPFECVVGNITKIDSGKYRAIIKTNGINMDDMNEEDKNVVLSKYAEYISAIAKPQQIFIPSFTLDIRERIEVLEKRYDEEDDKLREWILDDINQQKSLLEENDVIDTQFYLIYVTNFKSSGNEQKDYLRAKKELSKMIKYAKNELEGIGLKIKQLEYEDIGKLYYYFLNPFSAGIQEPIFDDNLITGIDDGDKGLKFNIKNKLDVIEEDPAFNLSKEETNYLKQGNLSFKNKVAPYSINDKESGDYIKVGSTYMTIYEIYDYPTNLPKLWAKKLYKFRENIDISIHIKPIPTSSIVKELDRAQIDFGSALIDVKTGEKKKATTFIEKKNESTSRDIGKIMDELDSGEQSFYHFSMYVLVKERSLEKLEDICLELENVIGSMRVMFRKCSENMKNALFSVFPIGVDFLETTRNMLTKGVVNSFPFVNFSFSHKTGFFLGTHKYNNSFVYFNPFELDNANGSVLGASGGGKSTAVKKIIKGLIDTLDIPIRVIDPEGENIRFAESVGAQVVDYFVGSKHKINVLEPEIDDEVASLIKPQINFVKIFLGKIMSDLAKSDFPKIDYSLNELYKRFGFTDDKDTYWDDSRKEDNVFVLGRSKRKAPELINLYHLWESNELIDLIGDTRYLAAQLREWTRLGTNDLFDGETNVDFNNKRIYFNLKHLDKSMKGPGVFVLMQKLWDLARRNPLEYKVIIMEEAHVLFREDDMGEYVYDINKRIRKYGGGSIYVTQNITDFMKTKWGPEIIKNCSWSILVKQNKRDIEPLQDSFEMTRSEAYKMTSFNRDEGEAYLIADKFRIPINVKLSDKELRSFTTKTSDLRKLAAEKNMDNVT